MQIQQKQTEIQQKQAQIQQKEIEIISYLKNEICQKDEQVQQLPDELHQPSQDNEELVATLLEQKDVVIRSMDDQGRNRYKPLGSIHCSIVCLCIWWLLV